MATRFACASCGKSVEAPDELAGRKARCPHCQAVQVVPGSPRPKIPARMLASAQAMQARLDAAKTRISQVGARERLAQSQANLAGLRAELYGDCRPGMFDHLDVRLDDKESRIAAREILASDPLDLQLAELSTHGPSADERLAELRRTAQAGETAAGETAET